MPAEGKQGVSKRRRTGTRRHYVRSAPYPRGGRALEVDGVVQSIAVDLTHLTPEPASLPGSGKVEAEGGYWSLLLPAAECPRRALILGLGGGSVAALLAWSCPGVVIVGVERDETVLGLARSEFGLEAIPDLEVVVADAFAWVARAAGEVEHTPEDGMSASGAYDDMFDYICLDLYEGGRLAPGTLATSFLRQLAALLAPGGTLAVNLIVTGRLAEQLHRLRRVFAVAREQRVRGNLVLHLRVPASRRDELPEGER
jgi:SAM-dependent methyltransferase